MGYCVYKTNYRMPFLNELIGIRFLFSGAVFVLFFTVLYVAVK